MEDGESPGGSDVDTDLDQEGKEDKDRDAEEGEVGDASGGKYIIANI